MFLVFKYFWYFNVSGIQMVGIQIPTVLDSKIENLGRVDMPGFGSPPFKL